MPFKPTYYFKFLEAGLHRAIEMQMYLGHIRLGIIFGCGAVGAATAAFLIDRYTISSLAIFYILCAVAYFADNHFRHLQYKWRYLSIQIQKSMAGFVVDNVRFSQEELISLVSYVKFSVKADMSTKLLRSFIVGSFIVLSFVALSDPGNIKTVSENPLYQKFRSVIAYLLDLHIIDVQKDPALR